MTTDRIRLAERATYAVIALVLLVAFGLQFYLLFTGGADANSGEAGSSIPLAVRFARLFSFFTILSNVLVLVVAIAKATGRGASWLWRLIHLDALLSIVVTGSVFGLILAPGLQLRGEAVVATALFHNVSPVLFALAWLVFGPRRQWDARLALLAFIWPAVWLAVTFTRGAITGWYPYPFLDVNQVGLGGAVLGALAVVAYAAVLAVVFLVIDRRAPALRGARTAEAPPTAAPRR
ncbi:Pr6Pr family membrane protein [Schumannella sp. 10F1B-5-1]|uniref:Pr6Pr family membrane protein n=1 Tax=Schumannella sp. 10F1B-5-1 TaxID=2590780 RepID=UPI0011303025|nr:Pr6Pr family membrane protein [Schumannella sp. 10F1B-5-1]TPW71594.1 hypothetical protein FJ658_09545 [Schumannella sp. 10F1B-5-1]